MIQFTLPIKTVSEANCRDHWAVKQRRVKGQRGIAKAATFNAWTVKHAYPYQIKLTRIGKRLLDDDNLRGAMKAIRDGVAEALRVNDGDANQATWDYAQETGKEFAVKVEIK